MQQWRLAGSSESLRLLSAQGTERAFGDETFTWANLLYAPLTTVGIYVLYFPSRFNLPLDTSCTQLLRAFGQNTPVKTSVNFWDPTDENFSAALSLFTLAVPPAVILATGLELEQVDPDGPEATALYSITYSERDLLSDTEKFVRAVNLAHEILLKGDPKEIAALVRRQNAEGLLHALGRIAAGMRDQLIALKPTVGLPGGVSLGIGG